MSATTTSIVLVEPQHPGNIGAAARVMRNFAQGDLRLVGAMPVVQDRWLAVHAEEIMEQAGRYDDLAAAVADADRVVALSRRTGKRKQPDFTPRSLARWRAEHPELQVALVFGRETFGLTDQEAELCPLRCRIPVSGDQPSLNLGQAVAVVCYELALHELSEGDAPRPVADVELTASVDRMMDALVAMDYFDRAQPDDLARTLRRILARADVTERELRVVEAIFHRLQVARVTH